MLINIFDTETTDLDNREVVELAAVLIDHKQDVYHFQEYAKPNCQVSPGAEQVHGISNAFLQDKRPSHVVVKEWQRDMEGLREPGEELAFVAHNLKFDVSVVERYITLPSNSWRICTLRLSRMLYPDAPDHKLTTMHRVLGLTGTYQAHSALDDVLMCKDLLFSILQRNSMSIDDAARMCSRPIRLKTMPFGKHKGEPMTTVPTSYMRWMMDNVPDIDLDVLFTFQCEISRRAAQ